MNQQALIDQLRKELTELQEANRQLEKRLEIIEQEWADFKKPVQWEMGQPDPPGVHQR